MKQIKNPTNRELLLQIIDSIKNINTRLEKLERNVETIFDILKRNNLH